MKATGIVRRIDDLGRVVIPKEIRKTLKVKEGMPLEIYTDKEGGIVLRKFMPFSEMSVLSEEFAQCVAHQTDKIVFITDREKVIAAAGDGLKGIVGKEISHSLESLPLAERSRFIPVVEGMDGADEVKKVEQVRQMIRSNGQIIGSIIIQSKDPKYKVGEFEKKVAMVAAEFLGKQITI